MSDPFFENFTKTITTLELLIHKLELSVGVPHKKSPFENVIKTETVIEKNVSVPIQGNSLNIKSNEINKKKENQASAANNKNNDKKNEIDANFLLFKSLDIRVGKIIECWKHPESEKLYCERIDFGTEIREIASGVQKEIPIEQMKGLVMVAFNLKPKKMAAGFISNGMVFMASENGKIELLRPEKESLIGQRIFIEGLEEIVNDHEKEISSSKTLEKILKLLKTDENGIAQFNGKKLLTKEGMIRSESLKNAPIS